ncbi:MAG: GGDEF domain-containing protein [Lachnospiraceae bacterium]|nr:GGDEF domain-containing protein [Lachnospiraceae bacterium]
MNRSGTESSKKRNKNKVYHMIYAAMAGTLLVMVMWAAITNRGPSPAELLSEKNTAFDEGWYMEDGSAANMDYLHKMSSVEPYQEESVYHSLPSDLGEGEWLCFRTKNISYQVYVDGELRYEPGIRESRVYNHSFGTRWNYVPLLKKDAGALVEIRFQTVYKNARACIDHLMLGSAAGEVAGIFTEKVVAFSTCLLLLFAGLVLIIADIPANLQMNKNHELLYLGLFAIGIAVWCLVETNLLQFYTDDSRLLQLLSCGALMMNPIPLILYLDAAFGFRKKWVVPVICFWSAAEFTLCTVLHFTGVRDYHETLTLTHILLAVTAIILVYTILKNAFLTGESKVRNVYKAIRTTGLIGIGFTAGIDIVRYYNGHNSDNAMFMRIGLLIFILCYGSASLEKMVNAVKLGTRAEFVSQLAYQDGLTGVGNRTAFQERLEELEGEKKELSGIAIVMFDVNDLKYVNDNLGHQRGDELITGSANIIRNALESEDGVVFRIGGDEFAGIISGEDVTKRCEMALTRFKQSMDGHNAVKNQALRISIASGYAVYDNSQEDKKLMDVYQQADVRMYENKKQIKSEQVKPAEFYAGRI